MKKFLNLTAAALVAAAVVFAPSALAAGERQSESADSVGVASAEVRTADVRIRPVSFILPAALVAVGAWGVSAGWLGDVNHWASNAIGGHRRGQWAADVLQLVPDLAMVVPLGADSRYSWRERVALTVTGELITEVIVQPVKRLVDSPRPDGSDNHSFPSGHAARAFMGAELLRASYGTWGGVAGYGVALVTAGLRIAADRHTLTDVIGGAGVGIASARLAMLLLPLERRLLGPRVFGGVVPTVDPVNGSVGLAASLTF